MEHTNYTKKGATVEPEASPVNERKSRGRVIADSDASQPSVRPALRAKLNSGENFLKRKHGGVHPERVADYTPEFPVAVKEIGDEKEYWGLTDSSSYSEYAWAFLRRNRFYQRLIDGKLPNLTEENWEYAQDTDYEPPSGLVRLKHYREAYSVKTPVEWSGIHTFRDQLKTAKPTRREPHKVDVEWPSSRVALIFDIKPMLGKNTSAIDVQLAMAKVHLQSLAESEGALFPKKTKPPSKSLLRAQLRVADFLSAPHSPPPSAEEVSRIKANPFLKPVKAAKCRLTISQVAELIPSFDVKRTANKRRETTQTQKLNRASELAVGAWRNIYQRKFLNWLQFDDWGSLFSQ